MVEVNNMRVMHVLADATNVIAEGEVLQLMNCNNPDISEDDYLQVIRYKTAKLFEAAGRLGAILGNAPSAQEEALAAYGMHLGTAFQLIDDVLDYSGDLTSTGKNVGDDLAEGKPTLPLIYAMRRAAPEDATLVRKAIQDGGLNELRHVVETIRRTGALDYTRRQAETEVGLARDALQTLPKSKAQDCLLQLAAFAVARDY
jgi:octaprenyl-diphosphate synthase